MSEMWELNQMDRRYSVPPSTLSEPRPSLPQYPTHHRSGSALLNACEDLHAWSIYRQNLNSGFTDSALGSQDKAPLPYGNFQLRESTVQSIINNPRYGPKSDLGSNMYTYLKFGLPRVFPPALAIRPRDGSSGYDSSDDGVGGRRSGRGGGSSPLVRVDRYTRSKSNPDLLQSRDWVPTGQVARETRTKSSSEANLLQSEGFYRERRPRGASRHGGSQVSLTSKRSRVQGAIFNQPHHGDQYRDPPMLNDKLFPRDGPFIPEDPNVPNQTFNIKTPHLQVRGLVFETKGGNGSTNGKTRLLDGISMEVKGGELLAILSTSDNEGTCLLDILGGDYEKRGGRLTGDFIINGNMLKPSKLAARSAYVKQDVNFCPDMSVRQTILLHAFFRESGDPSRVRMVKARINALIEDLGLEQVKHTRVKDLTLSERRRLNVACHLLLETDIVILDQPTKGMDIFDTFFLVEYLRQWACRGRIVILTIQPPTYEIFTMISRVALISTGRLMYFGRRREMLPYFAYINFPCPAYKNPSDYYIDLVTLDDLHDEAMLESTQRVEMLADTFRRRQDALSDPGPPVAPPYKVRKANVCIQLLGLWIRAMIYQFPYNMMYWLTMCIMAGFMSIVIGAVFWDVRSAQTQQQESINNRISFHYVMTVIGIWPVILMSISEVWRDKPAVTRDVDDKLYSRTVYIITKMFYSFMAAGGMFLSYIIPAYTMAGFRNSDNQTDIYWYTSYMLLYLYAVRAVALACASFCTSRHIAAAITGFFITVAALGSGYSVHIKDISLWAWPTAIWSPVRWVLRELTYIELAHSTDFACDRNPVMKDLQSIIQRKVSCGIVTGPQALSYLNLQDDNIKRAFYPAIFIFAVYVLGQLINIIAFSINNKPNECKKYRPD